MKAHLRNIRISPKKMSVVASMIRGKKVEDALKFLKFTPKKAAHLLYKVVSSAAANAENNFQQNKSDLVIKNIVVTQGASLKRGLPVSRGRWHPIKKRTAHVTVAVATEEQQKKTVAKKVTAKRGGKTETKAKIAAPTQVTPEEAYKKMEEVKTESSDQAAESKGKGKSHKPEQDESDVSKSMHRREGM